MEGIWFLPQPLQRIMAAKNNATHFAKVFKLKQPAEQ
jgi:hypothetical protein